MVHSLQLMFKQWYSDTSTGMPFIKYWVAAGVELQLCAAARVA
jgi:hypothetical protein